MKQGSISKRGDAYAYEFTTRIPLGRIGDADAVEWRAKLADAMTCIGNGKRTDTATGIQRTIDRLQSLHDMLTVGDTNRVVMSEIVTLFRTSPMRSDCSPETLSNYERIWQGFADHCVGQNVVYAASVTPRIAQEYATLMWGRSMAATTYSGNLRVLRMIWKVVMPDKPNPFVGIPNKREEPARKRPLTAHEIERLLGVATGEAKTIIMIAVYTGLRFGDCCKLRTDQVDLAARTVNIRPSKTKRRGGAMLSIPIHPELASLIGNIVPVEGQYCPQAATEYLLGRRDKPHRLVMQCFKEAAITGNKRERIGFHSLRYSFVTQAAAAGIPLAVIGSIVGHSTVKMTEHYLKPGLDSKRAAVLALPEMGTNNKQEDGKCVSQQA